jgi:hypothetical protein
MMGRSTLTALVVLLAVLTVAPMPSTANAHMDEVQVSLSQEHTSLSLSISLLQSPLYTHTLSVSI